MNDTEDVREVLNIPTAVAVIGPDGKNDIVDVGTLPAIAVVQTFDRVLVSVKAVFKDSRIDRTDGVAVCIAILRTDPLLAFKIIAPATNKTPEYLSALAIDDFLEVLEVFAERHRRTIEHFLSLGEMVQGFVRDLGPTSRKRSTRSSAQATATATSANSPGNNSEVSDANQAPAN